MQEEFSMNKAFIKKLKDIIEINLENEKFGVIELASEIGLSRSQLHRRLKDINEKSTSQFIREYRLERAMDLLKKDQFTASEVAYRVGFTSPTYFNTCFRNFYGYPPGEVKFQRAIALPKKTFSKKIIATIPVIILIGLLVFNQAYNKSSIDVANLEKTIAVLPFVNNSSSDENLYFCNGIMAGIRDHLTKIPEFYVVSRRSVEPYRNTTIPLKTIAKELSVNYVIEGQVQRISNRAIISAELIRVNDDKVLWSESYDRDITEVFTVQTNVIQSITSNLETIISPNLNAELISKPTQDTLAYQYYLKGEEYFFKADRSLQKHKTWLDLINKAESSYKLAIKSDSLYASAYIGLALITFNRYSEYIGADNNIHEALQLINKAIELRPNSAFAYNVRGDYFYFINNYDKAILDYEKSLAIYPNNVSALLNLTQTYKYKNKYKEAILMLKKTEKFARSRGDLNGVYTNYLEFYRTLDNPLMVDYYFAKIFKLQTTKRFRRDRVYSYIQFGRYDEALNYVNKTLLKDNQQRNGLLGYIYLLKKDFKKGEKYYEKCYEQVEKEGVNSLASSLIYWGYGMCMIRNGQIEKGRKLLMKQVALYNAAMLNSKENEPKISSYYMLIFIYAALGDIEKSNEFIDKFEAVNGWLYWNLVLYIKNDFGVGGDFLNIDLKYLNASIKRGEKKLEAVQNQIRPYLPSTPPTKTD